jgi:thiol-disulfide isomerase/thioredoxin
MGVPISWFGIIAIAAIELSLAFEKTRLLGQAVSLAAAFFAVFLQFRVVEYIGAPCPWCVATAAGLCVGTLASLASPRYSLKLDHVLELGLAASFPFLLAGFSAPPKASTPPIDLGSTARNKITQHDDKSVFDLVVFGSPDCPACREEYTPLKTWASQHKARFTFRPIAIHRSANEIRAMGLMLAARNAHDEATMDSLMSSTSLDSRIASAKSTLKVSESTWKQIQLQMVADRAFAKELGIRQVPLIIACAKEQPCQAVDSTRSLDKMAVP